MDDTTNASFVKVIASGSSGNATLLQVGGTRLLVDCGVGVRRIEKALGELGWEFTDLHAIVVTHEHSDHVKALEKVATRALDVPFLMTRGTQRALRDKGKRVEVEILTAGTPFAVGHADIVPFANSHDAAEPIGLRIESSACAVGIATDLGVWSKATSDALADVDILLLEANHDRNLLNRGPYPHFLKRRVGGPRGHLANVQAQALLDAVAHDNLQALILSHMSDTNNEPLLAEALMAEVLHGLPTRISTASQAEISDVMPIQKRERTRPATQTSLF